MDMASIRASLDVLHKSGEELLGRIADFTDASAGEDLLSRLVAQIEQTITQYETDAGAKARLLLEQFLDVKSPGGEMPEMAPHKEAVRERLAGSGDLTDFAKPFALFIGLMSSPDMDLPDEDGDILDNYFGRAITRMLYRGRFAASNAGPAAPEAAPEAIPEAISEAISEEVREVGSKGTPDEARAERSEEAAADLSAPAVPQPIEQFEILTQKERSSFSAKSFISDYEERQVELHLIHAIAKIGAITRPQLEKFVFSNSVTENNLDRLIRDGYVSVARHKPSGLEFYILSGKGAQIYRKEKSLKMLNKVLHQKALGSHETILEPDDNCAAIAEDPEGYMKSASAALYIARAAMARRGYAPSYVQRMRAGPPPDGAEGNISALIPSGTILAAVKFTRAEDGSDWMFTAHSLESGRTVLSALTEGHPENADGKSYICDVPGDLDAFGFSTPYGSPIELEQLLEETLGPVIGTEAEPVEEDDHERLPDTAETARAGDPFDIAAGMIKSGAQLAQREKFDELVSALLRSALEDGPDGSTDYWGRAAALLHALSLADGKQYGGDFRRLLYATDFPAEERAYTGEAVASLFGAEHEGSAQHLAALMRALFAPDGSYDYMLADYARNLFEIYDATFAAYPALKSVLNELLKVQEISREAFSDRTLNGMLDEQARGEAMLRLSSEAGHLINPPRLSQRINGLGNTEKEMPMQCFGSSSKLGFCMEVIAKARVGDRERVAEIFNSFTDRGRITEAKLRDTFTDMWRRVREPGWNKDIIGMARAKIIDAFRERLGIVDRWLSLTGDSEDPSIERLGPHVGRLRKRIDDALHSVNGDVSMPHPDKAILRRALDNMLAKLEGRRPQGYNPADWLTCGMLPLQHNAPVIADSYAGVEYFEAWRRVLEHISKRPEPLLTILEQIDTDGQPLYDNLGQAIAICNYIGAERRAELYGKSMDNAAQAAEAARRDFCGAMELDFAYGRVGEQSKETVLAILGASKDDFRDNGDFARFRGLLQALRRRLDDEVEKNRAAWFDEIRRRRHSGSAFGSLLDNIATLLQEQNANFIFVEEQLSRLDGKFDSDMSEPAVAEEDDFSEFINERYFNELSDLCRRNRGGALRNFAAAAVKEKAERAKLSSRYVDSAQRLVRAFPNEPKENGAPGIKTVLDELGFNVSKVTRDNPESNPARFTAHVSPEPKNRDNYDHPIAEMGTRLGKELPVMELFGNWEPKSIVSEVRKADFRQMPIVLLNGFLSLAQRRYLSKLFLCDGRARNPFILVDWVLLIHLALKVPEERLRVLLSCAMPYTGVKQLFSLNSVAPVADEMYIGRSREISQILDMQGPVVVYGGRQLGKTALLLRAKNLFHAPEEHACAVYADVKECSDELEFASVVDRELADSGVSIKTPDDVCGVCDGLREWFRADERRRLLLLIDESDNFLAAMRECGYAPLSHLEALCKFTGNRFHFVFAGLHNVFLAAQRQNNTIFGHFGQPMCIRPMSQTDAYKLLSRPLRCLGFTADEGILMRLLVSTNYYPGVIHFLGSELISLVTANYADHYNDQTAPPFKLTDRQIGAVMNSSELNKLTEERIRMTLDVDPAYMARSRCMAYLYYLYDGKRGRGYSVGEIVEIADALEIGRIKEIGATRCAHLLSEMCDMSILIEKDGLYRFRQMRFLSIVGKSGEDIEAQVAEAREGAGSV
ncbi:MAG: ATP-binding protein [Oscillospiraceae bacterium]|jgi:hypothetical protein|nr:ATP-binding protein [Oscillospiraceae bacterium]